MSMAQETQTNSDGKRHRTRITRTIVAIAVLLMVSIYVVCIVVGGIPADQRLSAADVWLAVAAVLGASLLLRPELLDRLTHLKFGSFEADLRDLAKGQKVQQQELDDIRLVLTLLVQKAERNHLENLERSDSISYEGNHQVRSELRRLRTLGLIRNRKDRTIAELKDGTKRDLKEIVELTDRGRYYLERVREEIDKD
jgi:hypothetical protein